VQSVRGELTKAIGAVEPVKSINIVFVSDGRQPVMLSDAGPIPASPENKRRAYAFLAKAAATRSADPLPALKAGLDQKPDLLYFLSDARITNPSLPEAAARLTAASKTPVFAFLYGNYDQATEDALQRIAEGTGGHYRYVSEEDLKE